MSQHSTPRRPRRVRFLVKVVIAVLAFTWLPTVAQAAFFDAATAPVSVGTYLVQAPATLSGTRSCNGTASSTSRTMSITIDDFGAVPRATAYIVTLTASSGRSVRIELPSSRRSTPISVEGSRTASYTLSISARVGTWTSPDPLERTYTC